MAEGLRTLLQFLGDLTLIPLHAVLPGETPMVGYQHTPSNLEILERCPSLLQFKQTAWLRNTFLSFIVLMLEDFVRGHFSKKHVRRESLSTPVEELCEEARQRVETRCRCAHRCRLRVVLKPRVS